MKRAIVTGGAGFIGSHMVDLLLDDQYEVVAIDNLSVGNLKNLSEHLNNPNFKFVEQDITSFGDQSVFFENVDCVYHFAGIGDIVPSINFPLDYFHTNVQGTICILESARKSGSKRFVYAASSSCYGLAKTPTREDSPIDLQHPYAISKYFGEQAALKWGSLYGLAVNSIRIFNAYGTRSKTSGAYGAVMGVFLRQKIANKPLTVVGDGSQTRDFVNVRDLVKAFKLLGESDKRGEIFNVGFGKPVSVMDLVALLDQNFVNIPWRPGEPECTWADTTKVRNELHWAPNVTFEAGVKELLENIEYWAEAPLWDEATINDATKEWFQFLEDKSHEQ